MRIKWPTAMTTAMSLKSRGASKMSRRYASYDAAPPPEAVSSGTPLVIVPIVTFGLGCWQLYRLKWKLGLIHQLETKTQMEPIDLPQDLSELNDLEYRKVRLSGRFLHDLEIRLSPRWFIKPIESDSTKNHASRDGGGLISSGSKDVGVWVVTPFRLSDREGTTVLVNRGWVPNEKAMPKSRLDGQVDGEVQLVGIVRKPEKRGPFEQKDNPLAGEWHSRDVDAMAAVLGTEPIFLDATHSSTVPGGPIGGQTRVTLRNEHLNYVITWWGLSIFTAYLWYKKIYRKPVMRV